MAALLLTVAAVLGLVIVANATGVASVGFVVTTTLLGLGLAPFVGDSLERHIPSSQWDCISLSRETPVADGEWNYSMPFSHGLGGTGLYSPCGEVRHPGR